MAKGDAEYELVDADAPTPTHALTFEDGAMVVLWQDLDGEIVVDVASSGRVRFKRDGIEVGL